MIALKVCVVGDPMLSSSVLARAVKDVLGESTVVVQADWRPKDNDEFWAFRTKVEKLGPEAGVTPEGLAAAAADVDIIITHHTPLKAEVITNSRAQYIGVCRSGTENINVAAAKARGAKVMKTVGRNAEAVSDFTLALILAELRNLARGHSALLAGEWRKQYVNSAYMGDMNGKTVGLVGLGVIGQLVAKKLSSFAVRVLVSDPYVDASQIEELGAKAVSLPELLRESDFVSLHARLSEATTGMLGAKELALMKPTAFLINTARAGLVNEEALLDALQEKRIGGAALDVFWTEPLGENHPLLALDNVTLTPHLAGATQDTLKKTPYLLLQELKAVVASNKDSAWLV